MIKNLKEMSKDSIIYGSTSVLSQITAVFLVPFYTQELSPEAYGIIAMTALIVSFLDPVSSLGMESALFRYFAMTDSKTEKKLYFTAAVIVKICSVFVFIFFLLLIYNDVNDLFFNNQLSYIQYLIIVSTFFFTNITSLGFVVLRVERKAKIVAIINIMAMFVSFGVSIYLVLIVKKGITGALLAVLITTILRALLFISFLISNITTSKTSFKKIKKLLTYGLPQVPHKINARIIGLFTLFIINQSIGLTMAGLYTVAIKFAKPLLLITAVVQQAWAPYKFQIHREEKYPATIFKNMISFYWVLLIFSWSILSTIAVPLFYTLIDSRYWDGIYYIPFIMFMGVLEGIRFTISTGFELSERQKMSPVASSAALIVLLIISFSMLTVYPPYGFFIAQGFATITMGGILYYEARKIMVINYPFYSILLYLTINMMSITLFYIYQSLLVGIVSITISLVTTIGILINIYSWKKIIERLREHHILEEYSS